MKKTTQVYIVADLSGSMQGGKEEMLRKMVGEFVGILAKGEEQGDQAFEVCLVPFSNSVKVLGPWVASALSSEKIRDLRTNAPGFGGGTALRDAIGAALEKVASRPGLPALVSVFSDGEECSSYIYGAARLEALIKRLEATGDLTLTFAGPHSALQFLQQVGVPTGNFRPWDGSEKEMRAVAAETATSVSGYVQARGLGQRSSTRFYADASQLTTSGVRGFTKLVTPTEVRLVAKAWDGRSIADFYGAKFQSGKHYYELVKPETIQDDKDLVIFIRSKNEYRQGSRSVRVLLGLPEVGPVRAHPGPDTGDFQIFVQSNSVNRKLVEGQAMLTLP